MKHLIKISSLSLITFIISLFITMPVLAIPSLPSSFYGTVKVNAANVPDGTVIQALVADQVVAQGFSQTYQGNSVYVLDVPGDDTDTPAQDGGREGDTVQFKIGGVLADQTGVWHTGTNVNLDLTASGSGPIATPQDTPTSVPTQTAIVVPSSPTPTTISKASLTPTTHARPSQVATKTSQPAQDATQPVQPSQVATQTVQPSPVATQTSQPLLTATQPVQPTLAATKTSRPAQIPTSPAQPSLTPAAAGTTQDNGSGNVAKTEISIAAFIMVIIAGYIFLVYRKKKI